MCGCVGDIADHNCGVCCVSDGLRTEGRHTKSKMGDRADTFNNWVVLKAHVRVKSIGKATRGARKRRAEDAGVCGGQSGTAIVR